MIKILSANEFKQIYGRNVPPTLKKISPDVFSNAVRCHTLPRTNAAMPKMATSIASHMYTAKDASGKPLMSYKLKFEPTSFQTATTTVPSVVSVSVHRRCLSLCLLCWLYFVKKIISRRTPNRKRSSDQ